MDGEAQQGQPAVKTGADRQREYRNRQRQKRSLGADGPTDGPTEMPPPAPRREAPARRPSANRPAFQCAGEDEMKAWLDAMVRRRVDELLVEQGMGGDADGVTDDFLSRTDSVMLTGDGDGDDGLSVGPAPSESARSSFSLLQTAAGAALAPLLIPLIPRLVSVCVQALTDVLRARVTGTWANVRGLLLTSQPQLQQQPNDGPDRSTPGGGPGPRPGDAAAAPQAAARPAGAAP